jgi:hypothetical protein
VEADHRRDVLGWLRSTDDERPVFVTVTETVGIDAGYTDVSLWFVATCRRDHPLKPDRKEFRAVRWWTPADLRPADPTRFDPHLTRFCVKLWHGNASRGGMIA